MLQNQATPIQGGHAQGIGSGTGTPAEGPVQYNTVIVTFGATPSPAPTTGNISVVCTDAFPPTGGCPTVTNVTGSGAGPYTLTLSGIIPTRECTTFTFAGTQTNEKLQYQFLPGDVNLNGVTNTLDLQALVLGLNTGGTLAVNLARYDTDRSGVANTQNLNRVIQLLNGVNTTEAWNFKTVAACP